MGRFEGNNSIIFIVDERTYEIIQPISAAFLSKSSDNNTRERIKIKTLSRLYKFADFFDAYDCMKAMRCQFAKPFECKLYAGRKSYFMLMKTECKRRFSADRIALEFGERVSVRAALILAERAVLLSDDFYSDCAKING